MSKPHGATAGKLERMLEKITMLLRKAESTPYPAEAQALQEHAERLMVRYGIGRAQLDERTAREGRPREAVVERRFEVAGVYRVGRLRGLSEVARAFPAISVLQSTSGSTSTLYVIGVESDVAQVLRLFESLLVQVHSAMAAWWREHDKRHLPTEALRMTERRQFQMAFFDTVAGRLRDLHTEEVAASGSGTDLVLAGRRERVTDALHQMHPFLRSARSRRINTGSWTAHRAGQAAGHRANVGQRGVGEGHRARLPG